MFDRTTIHSAPTHKSVTVNEHKAPTDESVGLLREMESAARKSVLQAVQLDNNVFHAVVHTHHDFPSDKDQYAVLFKLNGKAFEVRHSSNSWDSAQDKAIAIRNAVAHEIANSILGGSIGKIFK